MALTHERAEKLFLGQFHTRRGPQLVLRGKKIWKGAICVQHNGRAMPAQSFDTADSVNDGGPLGVAGVDADGGLRLIAKRPGVRFVMAVAGAGTTVTTSVVRTGSTSWDVTVTANTSVIARDAAKSILGNAHAYALVDVTYTGTGGGAVSSVAITAVPWVAMLGAAQETIDNSDDTSNDLDVSTVLDRPMMFGCGSDFRANNYADDDVSGDDVGMDVCLYDDEQVSRIMRPLCLAVRLSDYSADAGPAIDLRLAR